MTTSKQSSGIYCDAFGAAAWQGYKLKVDQVISAGGSLGLQRLQNSCYSGHFLSCVTVKTRVYAYSVFISTQADFKIRVSKQISQLNHVLAQQVQKILMLYFSICFTFLINKIK